MEITVIGENSKSRIKLLKNIERVKKEIPLDIILIEDNESLEKYKHINKPVLFINDKKICNGKVLTDREIKNYVKLFA